jgi:hypothetical protein
MLFLCIHTHTVERCLAGKPEEGKKVRSDLIANFKKEGIKVLGYYSAPNEHAGYYVFDADDAINTLGHFSLDSCLFK